MIELTMEFIIVVIIPIITIAIGCIILGVEMKATNQTEKPIEKRYIYTILGRESQFNTVAFRFIESDTKLTYQQIKDKFSSIEVMNINVLDRKTGKF